MLYKINYLHLLGLREHVFAIEWVINNGFLSFFCYLGVRQEDFRGFSGEGRGITESTNCKEREGKGRCILDEKGQFFNLQTPISG